MFLLARLGREALKSAGATREVGIRGTKFQRRRSGRALGTAPCREGWESDSSSRSRHRGVPAADAFAGERPKRKPMRRCVAVVPRRWKKHEPGLRNRRDGSPGRRPARRGETSLPPFASPAGTFDASAGSGKPLIGHCRPAGKDPAVPSDRRVALLKAQGTGEGREMGDEGLGNRD